MAQAGDGHRGRRGWGRRWGAKVRGEGAATRCCLPRRGVDRRGARSAAGALYLPILPISPYISLYLPISPQLDSRERSVLLQAPYNLLLTSHISLHSLYLPYLPVLLHAAELLQAPRYHILTTYYVLPTTYYYLYHCRTYPLPERPTSLTLPY